MNRTEQLRQEAAEQREAFTAERMKLPGYAEAFAAFMAEANSNALALEAERRSKLT